MNTVVEEMWNLQTSNEFLDYDRKSFGTLCAGKGFFLLFRRNKYVFLEGHSAAESHSRLVKILDPEALAQSQYADAANALRTEIGVLKTREVLVGYSKPKVQERIAAI